MGPATRSSQLWSQTGVHSPPGRSVAPSPCSDHGCQSASSGAYLTLSSQSRCAPRGERLRGTIAEFEFARVLILLTLCPAPLQARGRITGLRLALRPGECQN
jgi:hypothetical protein